MMYGFMGNILVADLTKAKTSQLPIDGPWSSRILGGSGYASYLLRGLLGANMDPLGPNSPLLFMTGPLTGTRAPCSGRHTVCALSPLTRLWGESHAGGHFGANLKFAGFDGILLTGRSPKPVSLIIDNDAVTFQSAEHLWGEATSATQRTLKAEHGHFQISCIGPAGESLVRYAGIVHGERVAARCGLGAVMGSKNLKAIAVRGDQKVALAHPAEFDDLSRRISTHLQDTMRILREQGTAMYVEIAAAFNDMPIRYFRDHEFSGLTRLNASALEDLLIGRSACYSCPIGCGRRVSLPSLKIQSIAGPEYQSIASLGSNLLIENLEHVSYMAHLCNEYGMDTISCGNTIALATYLDELGKSEYGLRWNDSESVVSLIHAIARRKGIGNVLADGAYQLGMKHNAENLVLHVRRLEIPNHDPRSFFGMAAVYLMASRGATHLEGDMYSIDMGNDVRELGIVGGDRLSNDEKGMIAAMAQDYRAFYDSLILCHFADVPANDLVSLINLALDTGFESKDILKIGARAVAQKRLLNLDLGLNPRDERLPPALLKQHPDSVTSDLVPDVERQLNDYYEYRRWDRKTGRPRSEALIDLDLQ